MNKINKILKHITDVNFILRYMLSFKIFGFLPDKLYLKIKYRLNIKKKLNLKNPQTFNEKINYLKLYNRDDIQTIMADKYKARDYVKDKIGEQYLVPLIGVWDNPDDIDFDKLPNQFAMKCNHNSGLGMCICKDKSKLDIDKVRSELKKGIAEDYYKNCREWPYKNIPRKIICEEFLTQEKDTGLTDYKFFCFNGEPKFMYVSDGLDNHDTASISFLTMDWQFAEFERADYNRHKELPEKPVHYEKMIELAKILSEGFAFLRVDLYEIDGKIYFSELTFSPCGGFMPFTPEKWDAELGKLIEL